MSRDLLQLLSAMDGADASDLHLVPGSAPMYRVHGHLRPAAREPLRPDDVLRMLQSVAPPAAQARLSSMADLDFALQTEDGRRYRTNVFSSRGERGACFRAIPLRIPSIAELGLPEELAARIVNLSGGLVLITGVTGSGKTTTLAALIQMINAAGGHRIITIEEPIEYVYPPAENSIVTQREVGVDVPTFFEGLRSGLRQDPDVILVGEIRDRETAQLAISAAETGHLILATLHTIDAKGAVTRMVDLFSADMHSDIATQLSLSLRYVVAQHLLPRVGGGRRVLASEVLFANFAARNAIRHGKIESIDSVIQSSRKEHMWTLDADLRRLLTEGRITLETAREHAKDADEFGTAGYP